MNLTPLNKNRERRKTQVDLSTMVYGKIPPQAKDLEESILGAILLEREAFDKVVDILPAEGFYVEAHQRIYKAMKDLAAKSQPIDIMTVCEQLRANDDLELCGGPFYVTRLTNAVVSSANIEAHCRIVLQKFIQREIIRVCGEAIGDAYEDSSDPLDLLDHIEEQFSGVGQHLAIGDMMPMTSALVQAIQQIEIWRHNDDAMTGVSSGYRELDQAMRGWQNGDLIILAARPSVGKTAFALNLVRNAALHFLAKGKGQSVGMWSLEMKVLKLILRMLSAESGELLHKIQTGRLDDSDMRRLHSQGIQKLAALNVFYDDNSGLTMPKLRSKARKLKRKNKLSLIVIDYLQLMTPEQRKGTREQEVSDISRNLKKLAMELEVPIIALSQMSRDFEKRTGSKRIPLLSDLRESGSIEQDADMVMFLWGPSEEEIQSDASLLTRRYLKIAKSRDGVVLKIDLDFKDDIQLFQAIATLPELGLPGTGWRPIKESEKDDGPKLFIDTSSKMKEEKNNDEDPF